MREEKEETSKFKKSVEKRVRDQTKSMINGQLGSYLTTMFMLGQIQGELKG
jgi:hypothetical protein